MITLTQRLHFIGYREWRAYTIAVLFTACNIVLPQLFHYIPGGGSAFLPIMFLTLITVYKYGWQAGMLTAILSPFANHILLGMPGMDVLPFISLKSIYLAAIAGYAAWRFRHTSISIIIGIVISYQAIGMLTEWLISGNIAFAINELITSIPGILLQIVGGYIFIHYILKK